jgi:hypothetical protein
MRKMRVKDLDQFISDWKEAAAANISLPEFVRLSGLTIGKVTARQRSLYARGVELPLLRGQRGVGSIVNRGSRIKVRPKVSRSQNGEQFTDTAAAVRFVMYVGDC